MKQLMYNEFKQIGTNYRKKENVDTYYENMSFRNYEKEAEEIIKEIDKDDIELLMDIGCGDGGLTTIYSKYAKKVFALDISELMLEKAKSNCCDVNNIEFIHTGFLNYTKIPNTNNMYPYILLLVCFYCNFQK